MVTQSGKQSEPADTTIPVPHWLGKTLRFLLWGTLFGLAYGVSPLYTSNQHQYFLHGLARSGYGLLHQDWLANTVDPTPLFTLLVRLTHQYLFEEFFYFVYFILAGVYLYSLWGIADHLYQVDNRKATRYGFLGILFLLHSAGLRFLLSRAIGGNWAYLFDGGVAGQRLLGEVLQPSAFGVLITLSIERFLREKPHQAVLLLALAASFHPTYLLSAATLTAIYLFLLLKEGWGPARLLGLGGIALLLVLPVTGYLIRSFYPPSSEAQNLLVNFRIPAHAIPAMWLDETTLIKGALVAASILLSRRSPLSWTLFLSSTLAVTLTALQMLLDHNGLALLFPWRLSTFLLPLATTLLIAAGVKAIGERLTSLNRSGTWWILGAGIAMIALTSATGLGRLLFQIQQKESPAEAALYQYVRAHRQPGQLYAVPPKMQEFRLATGLPILADFKSIPYAGGEVLEWYQRVRLLQWFYRDQVEFIECALLEDFAGYGVTHVVLGPEQLELNCPQLQEVYRKDQFAVHRLTDP